MRVGNAEHGSAPAGTGETHMAALQGGGTDSHYLAYQGKEAEQQDGPVATVKRSVKRRLND